MIALVTGATGFIGSNLIKRLLQDGHTVIALGASGEQTLPDHPRLVFRGTPFYEVDWKEVRDVEAVFHQAAITDTRVQDRELMMRINRDEAAKFINEALTNTNARVVYASSCAVYGKSPAPFVEGQGESPVNVYGESKLELDEAIRGIMRRGCSRVVGLRYSNVFGPGESHKGAMASMVYQVAQQLKEGHNPRIFQRGEQQRDFIYIDDVVEANLRAAETKRSDIVNCGSGRANTFNDMVAHVQRVMGTQRVIDYLPVNPHSPRFQTHTECDMTRAEKAIGFKPRYTLEEGVSKYHASGALTVA